MLKNMKRLNFNPMAGFRYPLTVTLPHGKTPHGFAVCAPDIVCTGAGDLIPGFVALVIGDLSHTDEIDDLLSHEFVEDMILFGMNDGSCMMAEDHYGFKWEVSFKALPILHGEG